MAANWKQHLDGHNINYQLYPVLAKQAITRAANTDPGRPVGVAHIIFEYGVYRTRKLEELAGIKYQLEYYRNLQHQYVTKQISLESAARQAKFHEGIKDTEFLVKSGEIISRLQDKSDRFMEENYLV
jgi:hypothetical protein